MPTSTLSISLPTDTASAIARWTAALPAPSYLVTAKDAGGVELWRRRWPAGLLREAAEWLQSTASAGIAVSARPWQPCHILVRGLRPAGYARLAEHHRIAAAVEVAPGVVEAWITVAEAAVDTAVAAHTALVLAARHGGDLLAADAAARGHLPGLPNVAACASTDAAHVTRLLIGDQPVVDATAAAIMHEQALILGRDAIWRGSAGPGTVRPMAGTRPSRRAAAPAPPSSPAWSPAFMRTEQKGRPARLAPRGPAPARGRGARL